MNVHDLIQGGIVKMDVFGVLLKICLIEILKVKLTITFWRCHLFLQAQIIIFLKMALNYSACSDLIQFRG